MEAIYQCSSIYTKTEHMKFEQYAFRHNGREKKVRTHCLIMMAVGFVLLVLLYATEKLTVSTVWLPMLWVVGALVYSSVNGKFGRRMSWKMSPQVHDAHQHYFFYEDHMDYYIGESGISVPYESIHSIGETDSNIYIMLSAQQGMSIQKFSAPEGLCEFISQKLEESRNR